MYRKNVLSMALAVVLAAGCLLFGSARPAEARRGHSKSRENAWRTGTYVGGAATAAALAKGKGTWALIGAGATALSYTQWKKEQKRRHRDESYSSYRRYRSSRRRR